MGTHAAIGIQNENQSIDSIYCHYDGYLDGAGRQLLNYYNTPELVRELVALGDISGLGKRVGEKHDFNSTKNFEWCVAYHRDRGDAWESVGTITTHSIREFLDTYAVEYFYIFVESEKRWYVKTNVDALFMPLVDAIESFAEDLTN